MTEEKSRREQEAWHYCQSGTDPSWICEGDAGYMGRYLRRLFLEKCVTSMQCSCQLVAKQICVLVEISLFDLYYLKHSCRAC
jgi:hypothetical protein